MVDIEKRIIDGLKIIDVAFCVGGEAHRIGCRMHELNKDAIMTSQNWAIFIECYLSRHAPDVLIGMEFDCVPNYFSASYNLTQRNDKRANKLVAILRSLFNNEGEIYRAISEEAQNIGWDHSETFQAFMELRGDMMKIEHVHGLIQVIHPVFYTVMDFRSEYEFVFLDCSEEKLPPMLSQEKTIAIMSRFYNKTAWEAYENHVHIFRSVDKSVFRYCVEIGKAIAMNMAVALKAKYPQKEFAVFLSAHHRDGIVVKFHQLWDGEKPCMDVNDKYLGNPEMYEFR